jgi:hypothetical protein
MKIIYNYSVPHRKHYVVYITKTNQLVSGNTVAADCENKFFYYRSRLVHI